MRERLAVLQKAPEGEVQPSVPLSSAHAPPQNMEQQNLLAANASSSFIGASLKLHPAASLLHNLNNQVAPSTTG